MSGRHKFARQAGADQAHLRILSTTDLHMRILPHDYVADRGVTGQSLALAATTARHAAAEAGNAILFDTGDAFEGGVIDDLLADEARAAAKSAHPMADALAAAGVAAHTLGNHDFNHGLAALCSWLAASPVPVVLSNIVRRRGATPLDDTPLFAPTVLLRRTLRLGGGGKAPITLGLLGLAPPQTLDWDQDKLAGQLMARDILEAAASWGRKLRYDGADLVIALCHSGIGAAAPGLGAENAATPLAALPEVDVVLAGHSHRRFPAPGFPAEPDAAAAIDLARGRVHGTPAAMPGFWGGDIGRVDLLLQREREGWRIADSEGGLRRVRTRRAHPAVVAAGKAYHTRALAEIRTPVGRTGHHLHTYFAMVADSPVVRLNHGSQFRAADMLLKGLPEAAWPRISASAPLKAGGLHGPEHYTDVPPGPILRRNLSDLYIYANALLMVRVTGQTVRRWLERSASAFRQIAPGARDASLLDPAHASYSFDCLAGLTYRIDLAVPAGFDQVGRVLDPQAKRICDLCHDGRPIADDDRFVLITNGYRCGAGNGFPGIAEADRIAQGGLGCREALARHIAAGGAECPLLPVSWGFVPMPGTTVLFSTGPGARAAGLPGTPGALKLVGRRTSGFDRWRLDLAQAESLGPACPVSHAGVA